MVCFLGQGASICSLVSEPTRSRWPGEIQNSGRQGASSEISNGAGLVARRHSIVDWIVGDSHGCSDELAQLVGKLALTAEDTLVSVGDLFHRGPDPAGVMDILRAVEAKFILGNHELRVLERFGLAPLQADGADRPSLRTDFPGLEDADSEGVGRRPCPVPPHRREEVLVFLQGHSGYYLESDDLPAAGLTTDDRAWCVVHAGPSTPRARNQPKP